MVELGVLFQVEALPQLLAVLGMVGLAGGLLYLDFESRVNRAFALFLVLRAGSMLTATLQGINAAADPAAASLWASVFPYFAIGAPFALAYFAGLYPRRLPVLAGNRWVPALLLILPVALGAAYLLDHTLWATYRVQGGVLALVETGPLYPVLGLLFVVTAAVSLLLAWEYIREPESPRRRGMLLIGLGFTANALFDGTGTLLFLVVGIEGLSPNVVQVMAAASLVFPLAALALLVRHGIATEGPGLPSRIRRFLAVCALAPLTAAAGFVTSLETVFLVATGVWRLFLPALVAYALMRHQLFDLDVKLRWGVEKGTVGAFFAGAFFVVSESAEGLLAVDGTVPGLVAAGGIALALKPVQHVAQRVARTAIPGAVAPDRLQGDARIELYREQLALVWADGTITERERRALDHLRQRLGIAAARARDLEQVASP